MQSYVITFETHFEALTCFKSLSHSKHFDKIKMIPVPRELSSACGTAVKVSCIENDTLLQNELENIIYNDIFKQNDSGEFNVLKV